MSVAVLQEEMFSSKCIKHDKPCMIKTGVKDGPNKGKSFLICSNTASPCDHRAAIDSQGQSEKVGRVLQDVNSLPQEKLQEKKSLVVKPKIKSDSAVQPMSDGSSSVAALTQSVIRSAKDPIAARQYIVSEIEKKKNLLRMASRLPDGGQKIKDQLRQLQEALVTCGNADVTTNTSDSKTASSVRPAFTSHSEETEFCRLKIRGCLPMCSERCIRSQLLARISMEGE
ncbi:hypothetical protein EB796_012038 [Bugula neritina]|uniref:GRF-type domain-containing protein n=1 Tax=Bugula neritina TaxID=10212 RepID=A0A7J7JVA5_BUGNE|nr:hypothetical protein EB796_012038 [Bugula neritina]